MTEHKEAIISAETVLAVNEQVKRALDEARKGHDEEIQRLHDQIKTERESFAAQVKTEREGFKEQNARMLDFGRRFGVGILALITSGLVGTGILTSINFSEASSSINKAAEDAKRTAEKKSEEISKFAQKFRTDFDLKSKDATKVLLAFQADFNRQKDNLNAKVNNLQSDIRGKLASANGLIEEAQGIVSKARLAHEEMTGTATLIRNMAGRLNLHSAIQKISENDDKISSNVARQLRADSFFQQAVANNVAVEFWSNVEITASTQCPSQTIKIGTQRFQFADDSDSEAERRVSLSPRSFDICVKMKGGS